MFFAESAQLTGAVYGPINTPTSKNRRQRSSAECVQLAQSFQEFVSLLLVQGALAEDDRRKSLRLANLSRAAAAAAEPLERVATDLVRR